jgi:2-iminobutanoate/2-iminopropanoate deaminase
MNLKTALAIVAVAAFPMVHAATEASQYVVGTRTPALAGLPFSDAVWFENTLYVSGHIGMDPKSATVPQDAALEAKLVLDAVKATIESAGLSMDDLVSVTVYCSDLGLYDKFNSVYKTYFRGNYPARAFVGVAQLLRGAHFEVQGIAVKRHALDAK